MDLHDPVSSLSHLATAVWAAFATLILLKLTAGHGLGRLAVGCYGASMVLLYLASGLFHGVRHDAFVSFDSFRLFQKLDKSAIYLLIAGSNLPVIVYLLRGWWRAVCLSLQLGLAAAGIAALWLLPDIPHVYLVGIYVGMGVLGLVPAKPYYHALGWRGLAWIGAFAAAYLGGAVVEVLKWPVLLATESRVIVGPHEILHICDTLGTVIHFGFVMTRVIPYQRPAADPEPDAGEDYAGIPAVVSG